MKKAEIARSHSIVAFLILMLIQLSCGVPAQAISTPSSGTNVLVPSAPVSSIPYLLGTTPTPARDWIQVYFSDPTAVHANDYESGPDEVLAAALDRARLSVDVAAYSLNLWSIRDALINAHKRGVVVRMVMESDDMENQEVQQIMDAGIPVIGDHQQGLMHNKFMIIDHLDVWTGSMNYTTSGVYKDNNNLLYIHSSQIAEYYTYEFEQMFNYHLFGPEKIAGTPNPLISIAGTTVEIYFSPEDKAAERIIKLIQEAQASINFLAYSFTSKDIGEAMMGRARAGVVVAGVMDNGQVKTSQTTEYAPFLKAGLDVRLDGNQTGLMHHKVIIIDQQIVITGSYNFTASAETTNDENVVIIFSPEVAAKYMEEFQRIFGQAQQP